MPATPMPPELRTLPAGWGPPGLWANALVKGSKQTSRKHLSTAAEGTACTFCIVAWRRLAAPARPRTALEKTLHAALPGCTTRTLRAGRRGRSTPLLKPLRSHYYLPDVRSYQHITSVPLTISHMPPHAPLRTVHGGISRWSQNRGFLCPVLLCRHQLFS